LLGDRAEVWREELTEALALIEAGIDFADEGDVPFDLLGPALEKVRPLRDEIARVLADERRGERLRDGLVVAIAGPPNAGKSSLLNRIARREAAIVSPLPGTTRDVIEVHLDLDHYPVTLLDTAGIRESDDPVEIEGVNRARQRAAEADLVLWVVDGTIKEGADNKKELFSQRNESEVKWIVRNKVDLPDFTSDSGSQRAGPPADEPRQEFWVSARTGAGVDALIGGLAEHAARFFGAAEPAAITRVRHRKALEEALAALQRAFEIREVGRDEVVAEELRLANRALGRLLGRIDVEEVLDVIFRDFCIGK
jgi:tRNA modification GTPase